MSKKIDVGICLNCEKEFPKKNPITLQYKRKFCCNLCCVEYHRKRSRKKKVDNEF